MFAYIELTLFRSHAEAQRTQNGLHRKSSQLAKKQKPRDLHKTTRGTDSCAPCDVYDYKSLLDHHFLTIYNIDTLLGLFYTATREVINHF